MGSLGAGQGQRGTTGDGGSGPMHGGAARLSHRCIVVRVDVDPRERLSRHVIDLGPWSPPGVGRGFAAKGLDWDECGGRLVLNEDGDSRCRAYSSWK